MSWLGYCLLCLLFWTPTGIFLGKANGTHGATITLFIQTGVIGVGCLLVHYFDPATFSKATWPSIFLAVLNGIFSTGAYFCFMKAFEVAPGKVPEIEMITALYPVTCVLLIFVIQMTQVNWVDEIVKIKFNHLLSAILFASAFASWFWKPEWTSWLKNFLK